MSEDALQRAVANYLNGQERIRDFTWFHPPNSQYSTKVSAGVHKAYGKKRGVPDCCILLNNGRTLFIELKTKRGYLSKEQKAVHERYKELGHPVYTVKTDNPYEAVNGVEDILIEHMEVKDVWK